MVSTRHTLLLLVVAVVALALTSGCFMMEANIEINVDGSADVEMRMAVSQGLMEMGEEGEDPFADVEKELPEGWKSSPLEEEGWKGIIVTGRAPAGGELLPDTEGGESDIKLRVTRRLFSTDYEVEGSFAMDETPLGKESEAKARQAEGRIVFVQQEGEEEATEDEGFDPEALMGLLGAMGRQPRIGFSLKAPGVIVETNGEINDEGAAVWRLDLASLMAEEEAVPAFRVYLKSRLLNQQSIGRLADELAAERDMAEMAALIADCVSRGLLPNPPRDNPLKASLDAEAYDHALSIIVALEDALGEATAARVVRGLKLNADSVTAKQLRETWELILSAEEEELVEVAAGAILKHVRMLAK